MPQLRDYQAHAVHAAHRWLAARRGAPLIVLPTGAGKSWVIAQLAADVVRSEAPWLAPADLFGHTSRRVLVLAHRKELLLQNAEKLQLLLAISARSASSLPACDAMTPTHRW